LIVIILFFLIGFFVGSNQNKPVDNVTSHQNDNNQQVYPENKKNDYESNQWILRKQKLILEDKTIEAVFTGGAGCVSCHAQNLYIYNEDKILILEKLIDPSVKVIGKNIYVKSKLSGGGATTIGEKGIVRVYKFDFNVNTFVQTSEYQEEYTLKDL